MKPRITVARRSTEQSSTTEEVVEQITLAEQVYRTLRQDIISGAVEPDQSLRLEFLKQRYGISFSPLREALNRLQSERLVVSTTSRGFRVVPFSVEEMWDAIETRILIDCEALRRSIDNADDRWEASLVGAYHGLKLAASRSANAQQQSEQQDEVLEARHLDFHRSLISACGSPWLMDLSSQMYAQTERYRRPSLLGRPRWGGSREVQREHQDLMDAAVARDATRATALLAQHFRGTGALVTLARKGLHDKEVK
jgi:GntR family carbon starvation induced transcriptional regulator